MHCLALHVALGYLPLSSAEAWTMAAFPPCAYPGDTGHSAKGTPSDKCCTQIHMDKQFLKKDELLLLWSLGANLAFCQSGTSVSPAIICKGSFHGICKIILFLSFPLKKVSVTQTSQNSQLDADAGCPVGYHWVKCGFLHLTYLKGESLTVYNLTAEPGEPFHGFIPQPLEVVFRTLDKKLETPAIPLCNNSQMKEINRGCTEYG